MAELIIRIKALLNKITVRKEEKITFNLGQYTFECSYANIIILRGETTPEQPRIGNT